MKTEDFARMKNALMNLEPVIFMQNTRSEIQSALREILGQTPELFWFYGSLRVLPEKDGYRLFPNYTMTAAEAYAAAERIEAVISGIGFPAHCSQEEAIDLAKNWILSHVAYGGDPISGQTIDSVFLNRCSVCRGMSKAFQLLLLRQGIPCSLQEGILNGQWPHVWNIVNHQEIDIALMYPAFHNMLITKEKRV